MRDQEALFREWREDYAAARLRDAGVPPAAAAEMEEQHRLEGFNALLADHRNSSHYFEEPDGTLRPWRDLSAEGKLGYVARDAALYGVPFERFAEAVREVLGDEPAALREAAALGMLLRNERELHALAELLPPDERLESTPLIDRFKEVLEANATAGGREAAGANAGRTETPPVTSSYEDLLQEAAARGGGRPEREPGVER